MGTRTSEDRVPVLASIHRLRLVKAAPGGLPLSTRWPGTVLRGGTTSTASLLQLQRDQARAEPAADLRQQLGVVGDAAAQLHRLDPAAGDGQGGHDGGLSGKARGSASAGVRPKWTWSD